MAGVESNMALRAKTSTLESQVSTSRYLARQRLVLSAFISPEVLRMGLLTIIRKNRQKEKEMRILFL